MMDPWVIEVLKSYGLAGVVIAGLALAVWSQRKELMRLHEQRASEREQMAALMEKVVQAQNATAESANKRNETMEELADALNAQAVSVSHHTQMIDGHQRDLAEKLKEAVHVVDSFGESNRVWSGVLRDIQSGLERLTGQVQNVAVEVKAANRAAN